MFISSAFAASSTAAATTGGFSLMSLAPLAAILFIFYIFILRPQNKSMADFNRQVSSLRRGDRIVTTGGLIGTIHRVEDKSPDVTVEIADGVRVRIQRSAISEILAKGEPVPEQDNTTKKSA